MDTMLLIDKAINDHCQKIPSVQFITPYNSPTKDAFAQNKSNSPFLTQNEAIILDMVKMQINEDTPSTFKTLNNLNIKSKERVPFVSSIRVTESLTNNASKSQLNQLNPSSTPFNSPTTFADSFLSHYDSPIKLLSHYDDLITNSNDPIHPAFTPYNSPMKNQP